MKTVIKTLRVDPEKWALVEKAAAAENRSVNAYVWRLIETAIEPKMTFKIAVQTPVQQAIAGREAIEEKRTRMVRGLRGYAIDGSELK